MSMAGQASATAAKIGGAHSTLLPTPGLLVASHLPARASHQRMPRDCAPLWVRGGQAVPREPLYS